MEKKFRVVVVEDKSFRGPKRAAVQDEIAQIVSCFLCIELPVDSLPERMPAFGIPKFVFCHVPLRSS